MKQKMYSCDARVILSVLIGLFLSCNVFAQDITIKGNVKDAKGEPIIGASILEKGTTNGTVTDFDGNFMLSAPKGSTIGISYIGYKSQDIINQGQSNLIVVLQEDTEVLDEIVVIGYGTVKKDDATGCVTAIKPDKMNRGLTTTATDMINGKIAGVNITTDGGAPGSGASIRIRGGSSLSASNNPLIVIDGLPIDNDGIKGVSNPLSTINPNDIATFTVLKDASATAIYGSRASNGVILITTKKGEKGSRPRVTYDGNVSISTKTKSIDVMGADEYRNFVTDRFGAESSAVKLLGKENTDWQKEIFRTAVGTDHNITVSGGLNNMPYRVSVGYTNQNGILKTSKFERYTGSVNLAPSFFEDHLNINFNAKGMISNNRFADTGAIGAAIAFDPTQPVMNGNSKYGGYFAWENAGEFISIATKNPVAMLQQKKEEANSKNLVGNIQVDYKFHFLPELRANLNLGMDMATGTQDIYYPKESPLGYVDNGKTGYETIDKYNHLLDFYLQYAKDFNEKHHFDIMAGYSWQHFHRSTENAYNNLNGDNPTSYIFKTESYLISFFGRVNYSFMNRYLITATLRNDGTSRFSKDNRWSSFPSVALGWKLKEENFLKNVEVLSDLKLRLGWGITGQQNLGDDYDFPYMALYRVNAAGGYYPFGDTYYGTMRPKAYNEDLKWEETTTYNAGFDFAFLNGRISGSMDYYYRKTDDLINTVKIAAGTNFNTQLISNIGSLKNTGLEFTINAKPIVTKDFVWDLGYNITWNKNEITKLTGGDDSNYYVETGGVSTGISGATCQVQKVGYPMNSFFVYQQVYDKDGKPIENMFVDRNGDGVINASDKYIYKKPAADVLMGLTSKFTYKNWDLSFALRASLNNYVYNDVLASKSSVGKGGIFNHGYYSNRPTAAVNLGFEGKGDYYLSDRFVENASFLRCDNITVGYSFKNLLKSQAYKGINGRIYGTVQNPFVITKYTGLDPESVISSGNDAGVAGIDRNIYPHPITILFGLSLQF